jgi:hypothetical protein
MNEKNGFLLKIQAWKVIHLKSERRMNLPHFTISQVPGWRCNPRLKDGGCDNALLD